MIGGRVVAAHNSEGFASHPDWMVQILHEDGPWTHVHEDNLEWMWTWGEAVRVLKEVMGFAPEGAR